ncbi:hypothetical protein ASPBRDRAFT_57520 [Aspergillus brasiliensis CBS 101740]|uniref:Uncharacterized protein n=1 Tax=Aspergillus brasiliensis (strain CBS 101740 / IMI 381727 / IBT 21946) TaxID=767769 RepID=A0A1L9UBA5_ASPBC|nr:hypothetical protein ASPBRDRAFT_57520 [Aspergillus brasiliensis CBS 101740]
MGIELCVTKAMINRTPYHRPIGGISLANIEVVGLYSRPVDVPNKTLYSMPSSDRQRGLKVPRLGSQPDWNLNRSRIRSVGPLKQGAKGESVEGAFDCPTGVRRPRNMQQQGWGGKPQLFNLKVQQSPRHQQGRTPDGWA